MNNKYKEYLNSKEWLNTRLDIITIRKNVKGVVQRKDYKLIKDNNIGTITE